MLQTQIREMPIGHIREWYFAAFANDISLIHLFWLLPRVLEFLAMGQEVASCGNQVAFQRCQQTALVRDWPSKEKVIFEAFAAALVDARLDQRYPDLDAHLCMFALGGLDMGSILARLDQADPVRFSRAIIADSHNGSLRLGQDAFWEDGPAREAVRGWLADPDVADRLMDWAAARSGPEAELVWRAVGLLA